MVATAMMVDIGTLETPVTKLTMITFVTKVTTKIVITTAIIIVGRPSCIVTVIFSVLIRTKMHRQILLKNYPKFIYKQISPVSADLLQSDGMKVRQTRRSKMLIFAVAL
jgi:hypothetical protein